MGEVRVRVKLVNAGDEILVRRGLWESEQVRMYEAQALIDTGAVRCIVPAHVRDALGLAIVGERVAEYADGRKETVALTEPIRFRVLDRDVVENALVLGEEEINKPSASIFFRIVRVFRG